MSKLDNQNKLDKLTGMKKRLDTFINRANVSLGEWNRVRKELKSTFGVEDVEEAMKLKEKMEKELCKYHRRLERELEELEEEITALSEREANQR